MYPIQIERTAKKRPITRQYQLKYNITSLEEIEKYVAKNETFEIDNDEAILYVHGVELETPEEVQKRVAKEEAYMAEYKKRHK